MAKRRNRTISPDALALSWVLRSSFDDMKKLAIEHIKRAIERENGHTLAIAERLGMSHTTYYRLVQSVPELYRSYLENIPPNATGAILRSPTRAKKKKA